jgi:hypothetical protein
MHDNKLAYILFDSVPIATIILHDCRIVKDFNFQVLIFWFFHILLAFHSEGIDFVAMYVIIKSPV